MRKILAVLLSIMMIFTAFAFTACTANDDDAPLQGDGDIVRDADGNIVYDNVKLKMWSVTTGDDAVTQDRIVGAFNETYDGLINVEVTHISRYDLEALLNTTMQFDKENAPDVLFNHGSRTTEYVDKGWLQQVDFFFDKSGAAFDKADYIDSLLESVTVNGVAYGVPVDCHSAVVCIREDILVKNGLSIPTNYAELAAVCDKASELAAKNELWIRGANSEGKSATEWRKASTAKKYTAFPVSFGDMWVHEFADYTAVVQNGGAIVNADGMPAWNTTEAANGLQVLRDWIFPSETSANKSAMRLDYGSSYDVGNTPFNSGECIFMLEGPWTWQKLTRDFDLAFAKDGGAKNITTRSLSGLFAKDASAECASSIKGEGHAVSLLKTTASYTKAAAATLFMEYLANNSGIEWAKRGHLPAVRSVANSAEYKADPAYDAYVKLWGDAENYVVVPPTKYYSYVDSYFKGAAQKAMAANHRSESIKGLLDKEYKDCLDYIALYS